MPPITSTHNLIDREDARPTLKTRWSAA